MLSLCGVCICRRGACSEYGCCDRQMLQYTLKCTDAHKKLPNTLTKFCPSTNETFFLFFLFFSSSSSFLRPFLFFSFFLFFLFFCSSSIGATARCGLRPVEQYLSICPYLSPTLSIFSRPALEDLLYFFSFLGLPLRLVPSSSGVKIQMKHYRLLIVGYNS